MQHGFLREHGSVTATLYVIADLVAIVVGCLCAYLLRFGTVNLEPSYRTALVLGILLALITFPRLDLYGSWRGRNYITQLRNILLAWMIVGLGLVFIAFALKVSTKFSRLWFGYWGLCSGFFLIAGRSLIILIMRELRRKGHNSRNIAVAGMRSASHNIVQRVHEAAWSGLKIACVFDYDPSNGTYRAFPHGNESCLPFSKGLEEELTRRKVDEIWICLDVNGPEKAEPILAALRQSTIRQRLIPDLASMKLVRYPVTDMIGIPMLNVSATPIYGISKLMKDCEDKILALLFLLMASPVLVVIALAIKATSRGPILFKQRRHGADGRPIKVYKFRTMGVHEEGNGLVTQAQKKDCRVTPIGAFLRRTSLDELPQLLNVLQGRMSLVGPRPHALAHNEYYKKQIETYMQRHKIKPGITGWAQVNGWRGETDTLEKMEKRVECDMYYIENWSLWLDIKIIVLTLCKGLVNKNAY